VEGEQMSDSGGVAIVGMACRLPGAAGVGQYWRNLRDGVESITRFDVDQLIAAGLEPAVARNPRYVPARGVIEGGELFDRAFFGYSPAEAAEIDPQHRVFLECASAAFDDAGIDPHRFGGWVAVFAGCDMVNPELPDDGDEMTRLLGFEKDFLATRVAYKLSLRGPAITVQTACSTGLVAVHQAAQSLLGYECDAALAGGIALWLPQSVGYLYEEGHILSVDGHCRPFDARATGTVSSSGAGVLVLRRLEDALRDGDRIAAVLRGSAINNDGGEKIGYTAPSITGQREVIQFAHAQAGVDADDIGYVEAHGTATRVGDPVEVAALTAAFRAGTERTGYCWLGAVKSNIGHTGSAAGVAGLIKTALQLRHRELVPTLHYERPNPELELDTSPFRVITRRQPWAAEGPLLAGVSSFGMGGTNAHAVLESPPANPSREARRRPRVFCVSAASPTALRKLRNDLADHLDESTDAAEAPPLDDVAWTLAAGRRRFSHRGAVVATDREEAAVALREDPPPVRAPAGTAVAFLFPGQGTLRAGFGAAAHRLLPVFRDVFDQLSADARGRFAVDLGTVLRPDADPAWLRDTVHQQLGLFALGYALARQFQEFGIQPAAMLGHSIGEYVAATVAGLWSPADALALIHERGRALRDTAPGRMLVVTTPLHELSRLLTDRAELALAVNGLHHSVLAGPPEAIEALRANGIGGKLVDTDHAFHSPLVRPAAERLGRVIAATPTAAPSLPFLSNLTGDWAEPARVVDADYWVDHLSSTVRLSECADTLLAGPCRVFVELGPEQSMARALRGHHAWSPEHRAVAIAGRARDGEEVSVLAALAALWECGFDTGIERLVADAEPRRCALPAHPFEPTSCERPRRRTACQTAPPARSGADDRDLVVYPRWAQCRAAGPGSHDAVLVFGDVAAKELVRALATDAATVRAADQSELDNAVDLAVHSGATAPAVVVQLPAEPTDDLVDRLDRLAEQAGAAGVWLVLLGHGLTDALGTDPVSGAGRSVLALLACRARTAPNSISLFDLGDGPLPTYPPASGGVEAVYAWRGRRWWALENARVPRQPVSSGPVRLAVVGTAEVAGTAADLAEHGQGVAAFVTTNPAPRARPDTIVGEPHQAEGPGRLAQRPELKRRLATFCAGLVGNFLLSQEMLRPGERLSAGTLRGRIDPAARLPRLADRLVRALVDQGWLVDRDGLLLVRDDLAAIVRAALAEENALTELAGLCRLTHQCVQAYPAVFSGAVEPASVIFPDAGEDFVRDCLLDNRIEVSDADAGLGTLAAAIRRFRAGREDRPLRILEVGAGGGELSRRLLDNWPDRGDVVYHFTDISPLRVRQARTRCAEKGLSGLRFSVFDFTRDPVVQGLVPGTFDVVIAYNVVHLAPSIRHGLDNLGRLLAPGGLFGMVEMVDSQSWVDLVWGLAPGWWDFDDELRRNSVLLDRPTWMHVLHDAGFDVAVAGSEHTDTDHAVLLAADPDPAPGQPVPSNVDGLLHIADQAADLAQWQAIRHRPDLAALPAWVVSADVPDWRGELARRRFDPGEPDRPRSWRHLELPTLDSAALAAVPRLLADPDPPPVARLLRVAAEPEQRQHSEPHREVADVPTADTAGAPADSPHRVLAEIWCEVLGVATVSAEDDFYELGGESLTSIYLMGRVRDRLEVSVPVTAFTERPTYAHLLGLVERMRPAVTTAVQDPSANLLVLRDSGDLPPLFLVAPAAGSSLVYRRLARLLGPDQPCYGLESPGLHDGTRPPTRFEDIAAHHVRTLRQVRPHGPYVLGGWSVGAMVAHEMARQLDAAGEVVTKLICFDACVVDTGGKPLARVPGFLSRAVRFQIQTRWRRRWPGRVKESPARGMGDPARDIASIDGPLDFLPVFNANIAAMLRYRPGRVLCESVVFVASPRTGDIERLRRRVAPLYRGTTILPAPGTHWTILGPRHVGQLAEDLGAILAPGACAPTGSDQLVGARS
jgi:acyl transferase domain-containing protein/SAM-dependent methyltransferase